MNAKRALAILLLVITGFSVSGCFYVNGEFRHIRNQLFSGVKCNYEKDVEFSLGSVSLWMAGGVMSLADVDKKTRRLVRYVSEVQIGVYKNKDHRRHEANPEIFLELNDKMEAHGWTRIVRSYNGNEYTAIMVKEVGNKLCRMFVISLDQDELVLTDITGDLEEMALHAIKERGLKFNRHS